MATEETERQAESSALWAAVDAMHCDMEADAEWASGLGLDPSLQVQIVERLRDRSAVWIADHMDRLIRVPVEAFPGSEFTRSGDNEPMATAELRNID
jgi:hypothetical protein